MRRINGKLAANPIDAQISETRVELRCAIAPHTTLPSANPPWNAIRYTPSARAYTHAGTLNCTDTFSVDIVVVHAKPAPISVTITTAGIRTSARINIVAM